MLHIFSIYYISLNMPHAAAESVGGFEFFKYETYIPDMKLCV